MLATSPLGDGHPTHRQLLLGTTHYLQAKGDSTASRLLGQPLLEHWRQLLDGDHPDTLASAAGLADALRALGEVEAARRLHQDTWDRRQRVLGGDHPDTLASAASLADGLHARGGKSDEVDSEDEVS